MGFNKNRINVNFLKTVSSLDSEIHGFELRQPIKKVSPLPEMIL